MGKTVKNAVLELENQAEEAVRAILAEIPFCRIEFISSDRTANQGFDRLASVTTPRGERTLVIEAKPNGQPRFVRGAVAELALYQSRTPNAYGIVVAPFISDDSAAIATEAGVGYVDLAGNCRISFDEIYIRREGKSARPSEGRSLRTLYSPKAERVLRTLLLDPRRAWKVAELAVASDVSLGQASNVKKLLEDREWLTRTDDGLRLADPGRLLSEWTTEYDPRRSVQRDYFSLDLLGVIEQKIGEASNASAARVALTGFSAAARYAPVVRYQKVSAYVDGDVDAVAKAAGLKPVTTGANVSLLLPYDAGVFAGASQVRDNNIVVSPVQAYLDLRQTKGRGEEAAEALLREAIEPTW